VARTSNQQSAISNQQSAISNQQSAISNQQSAISNFLSPAKFLVNCHHEVAQRPRDLFFFMCRYFSLSIEPLSEQARADSSRQNQGTRNDKLKALRSPPLALG
jgi:hypothetical protein